MPTWIIWVGGPNDTASIPFLTAINVNLDLFNPPCTDFLLLLEAESLRIFVWDLVALHQRQNKFHSDHIHNLGSFRTSLINHCMRSTRYSPLGWRFLSSISTFSHTVAMVHIPSPRFVFIWVERLKGPGPIGFPCYPGVNSGAANSEHSILVSAMASEARY